MSGGTGSKAMLWLLFPHLLPSRLLYSILSFSFLPSSDQRVLPPIRTKKHTRGRAMTPWCDKSISFSFPAPYLYHQCFTYFPNLSRRSITASFVSPASTTPQPPNSFSVLQRLENRMCNWLYRASWLQQHTHSEGERAGACYNPSSGVHWHPV